MEIKVNGIVLSATNYKEKDVLITIFTAELGKITAVLKGARGAKAKLKYATQPFCFGEWVLIKSGDRFVVATCSQQNSFFELTADYDKYSLACSMLQMCNIVLKPNIFAINLLVALLRALQTLAFENIIPKLVLAKFMLEFCSLIGFGFSWDVCGNCGCALMGEIKYSISNRIFTCKLCAGMGAVETHKQWYTTLKIIDATQVDKLNTINVKEDIINNCLYVLKLHIENVLGTKLTTLNSWV